MFFVGVLWWNANVIKMQNWFIFCCWKTINELKYSYVEYWLDYGISDKMLSKCIDADEFLSLLD